MTIALEVFTYQCRYDFQCIAVLMLIYEIMTTSTVSSGLINTEVDDVIGWLLDSRTPCIRPITTYIGVHSISM